MDFRPPYQWGYRSMRKDLQWLCATLEQYENSPNLRKELLLREQRDTETRTHDVPTLLSLLLYHLIDNIPSVALAYILCTSTGQSTTIMQPIGLVQHSVLCMMCVYGHIHHSTDLDGRGELCGMGSLRLLSVGFLGLLCSKCLYSLAIFSLKKKGGCLLESWRE